MASVGTPRGIPRPESPLSAVGAAARMPSRSEVNRLARPLASSPSFRTRPPSTDMTSGAAMPRRDDAVDDLSPAYWASALATGASRSPKIIDRNRWPRSLAGVCATRPVLSMEPMLRPRFGSSPGSVRRLMIRCIRLESPDFASRPLSMAGMAAESPRDTPLSDSPRSEAARAVTSGVRRPRTVSRMVAIAVPLSSILRRGSHGQAGRGPHARTPHGSDLSIVGEGRAYGCKATASRHMWEAPSRQRAFFVAPVLLTPPPVTGRHHAWLVGVGLVLVAWPVWWFIGVLAGTPPPIIAIGGAAAVCLTILARVLDPRRRQPLRVILATLLWGAVVAACLSAQMNDTLLAWAGSEARNRDLVPVVLGPVVEEGAKAAALIVVLLLARDELRSPLGGVVYGGRIGIGLVLVESFAY